MGKPVGFLSYKGSWDSLTQKLPLSLLCTRPFGTNPIISEHVEDTDMKSIRSLSAATLFSPRRLTTATGGAGEEQVKQPSHLWVQRALEQVEAKHLPGATTGWVAISQTNSSNKSNKPAHIRTSWGVGYGLAAKTTTDESQDHKQLPPEPHRMPQKGALSEKVSKRGSSPYIAFPREFLRACLKAKPCSQSLRNPEEEDGCLGKLPQTRQQLFSPPSSVHQDGLIVHMLLIPLLAEQINPNKEGS